ncbi:MAG: type IV toxin-antitoxin system AbiEi family antitoxin domain-containing protein [bacterium]|nr:type IV toxin-antitoxin system AbiEi family antitoxin domain-containing protein [bacterium]
MKYEKRPISDILRSNKTVFTFKDISLIWGDNDKKATIAGVNYYVKTGELYRIRRGIYAKDKKYDKLELATRILVPSYVSFETVLTRSGINFQYYERITVASYQTREIVIDGQTYSYKKIKDFVLTNSAGVVHTGETSMASPERAFLDTIYIHKDYHFDVMDSLNWDKVFELLPIYKNKRMAKKVNEFYNYYKATK